MTDPNQQAGQEISHHPVGIFLRGLAMGAADIVPGVSGGTIAFITGIYVRLLSAISGFPGAFFGELLKGRVNAFWRRADGNFLVLLFGGILVSIATLAGLIRYALEAYPVYLWSFFFGLIVASAWHIGKEVPRWTLAKFAVLVAGALIAWWITELSPGQATVNNFTILGAGALAICAMILPGISGSFILLMLGMYGPVLQAVNELQLDRLALFMTGCVIGLLSIARVLSWAFSRYRDLMLALLTGFMVGALNKVWPWKEVISWRTNSHGELVPLQEANLSPMSFTDITGEPAHLMTAIIIAIAGLVLVLGMEWFGRVHDSKKLA